MPKNRKHKKGKKKSSSSSSSSSRSSSSNRSIPISYFSEASGSKSNSILIDPSKQIEKIAFRNDLYSERILMIIIK